MPDTNVPAPDELFAVREQIKALTERERELRSLLLRDPTARTGKDYAVQIKDVTVNQLDRVEMRKVYAALMDEFTHPVTQQQVELLGIDPQTGELISLRTKAGKALKETQNGE